jgi:hypothetical protein
MPIAKLPLKVVQIVATLPNGTGVSGVIRGQKHRSFLRRDGQQLGEPIQDQRLAGRLYQAIDIKPPKNPKDPKTPEQLVYYDNGVGTENFKPIAALGGALGIGVWANVRDIYTFVCRNYAVGDQIYGFGHSTRRGWIRR